MTLCGMAAGNSQIWMVGGGIATMSAAVFLIRDAGVAGKNIHFLEQLDVAGGALDRGPAGQPRAHQQLTYVTRGGRMLEDQAYQCLWNLLESIPSLEDPTKSVRQEIREFNDLLPTMARARIINHDHSIAEAAELGLTGRDRLDMMRLLLTSERAIGARRIEDFFAPEFFKSHFWTMWRTTFAFQNWHSAIELRRYFLRFVQEIDRIHTLNGVRRTKYNQYDSIVRPIQHWLEDRGVDVQFGVAVDDIDFEGDRSSRRATRLHVRRHGEASTIELGPHDYVISTLGSMTADSSYGGDDSVTELIRDRRSGDWTLWENLAKKYDDFGRPNAFCGNIDESKWKSFTLTMRSDKLLQRITEYTGNVPGEGALMTWHQSRWLLSIVVPHQPHFVDQEPNTYTLWGYALFSDTPGDYVDKTIEQATGRDILDELIGHLGFDDIADEIRAFTSVTHVEMPYIDAQFQRRDLKDRPLVVPEGAQNFAFVGQFVEIPEDVVFTVEYSVHGGMIAAYTLFDVDRKIPPIYHGLVHPRVAYAALRTAMA
ncbi:MAG: oleate hydratase [Kofleriaceae bacterium]